MIDINPESTNALVVERQQRIKSCWTPRSTMHQPGPVRLAMGRSLIRFGEFLAGHPTIRNVSVDSNLQHRVVIS